VRAPGRGSKGAAGRRDPPYLQRRLCATPSVNAVKPLLPPSPSPAGNLSDYSCSTSRRTDGADAPPPLAGTSLWLLPEDSLPRLWLYDLVTSRSFDYVMFALILLNCMAMAYEYPHMAEGALDTQIIYWRWVWRREGLGLGVRG
jgi:hypothetical protein